MMLNRPQRIRLVVAAGLGLLALGVALVGAPLVAVLLWPGRLGCRVVGVDGCRQAIRDHVVPGRRIAN